MRPTLSTAASFGLICTASANSLMPPHITARQVDDPCTRPAANASVELGNWLECQVNGFFPYPANGAWDTAYDAVFSPNVLASFNQTRFDFDGFKALYTSFNTTIGQSFKDFQHGFLKTLGVPNSNGDKGGFVYLNGWEGGLTVLDTQVWFEDATFAVVEETADGGRTITEFREASNIPNTAPLPPSKEWVCVLP